jgi:chromosome segregation ATPase
MKEQELFELKGEIDEAKQKVSELTGQKNALMTQLKEDWGCDTIEEAEERLATMDKNITIITKKIEKASQELEAKFKDKEE